MRKKSSLCQKLLTGFLAAALMLQAAPVGAEENVKAQVKGLVIFYEGCTHQPDTAGVIQNDGECHSQVVAMDGINDSSKGQNYPQAGEGWSYNVNTNTLKLNNFKGAGIYALDNAEDGDVMTVELVGENTITSNSKDVVPLKTDGLNIKFKGSGSLKLTQKVGNDTALYIYDASLFLTDTCKVDVTGNASAVLVGGNMAVQGTSEKDKTGNLVVDKGCTLTAKTSFATEQTFFCVAIQCHNVQVQAGGTVIGVTASGKNNINSGIIAPLQWRLDPGVTLKSGATAATVKVAKLAKDKGIYYMSYGASAPYMEISNRVVSVAASVKTYSITYKLNGGTNNKANPSTYDGTKAIKLVNPTKVGYTFSGWYTDSKLTKKITTISKGTKINYVLYSKWTKKK